MVCPQADRTGYTNVEDRMNQVLIGIAIIFAIWLVVSRLSGNT